MKKLLVAASLAALLCAQSASAQVWTLAQCIDYAIEHNIQIKQQEISVAQREISLNTAENSMLPSLSTSASESFSFGRGLTADNTYANRNTSSTSFNVGADVPVFQGGRIRKNIAMEKLNLAAAVADLDKAKDDIRVAVAQAYIQILYNNEILSVAEKQIEIDSLQLYRIENLLSIGKTSVVEVAQQKSTYEQSKVSLTQAKNNLKMAILDMTQLLELPSPEGFQVYIPEVSDFLPLLESPESIYAQAVEVKPAIEAERTRLDYAAASVSYAKSAFLPTISLSGGFGTNYYNTKSYTNDSFFNQMKHNFSEHLGLSLSLPIFTRFSSRNNVRNAQLSMKTQELSFERAKKSLYKEIQQAYYNAVASQGKLRSSRQAAESAEQAFDLVQSKYETGKANITEYNEAKQRLFSAKSSLVQAQYECQYQCKILDFYKGQTLDF